jgi:hypothetical protein
VVQDGRLGVLTPRENIEEAIGGDVTDRVARIPELMEKLYRVGDELEDLFPGRPFTPDGHLVGSHAEIERQGLAA